MKKHEIGMLGLGFWQAWWMTMMCSPLLVAQHAQISSISQGNLYVLIATTLGYIVVAFALRNYSHIEARTALQYSAGICACLGSLLMMLPTAGGQRILMFANEGIAYSCFLLGVGILSVGNALLLFMWGSVLSKLASGRVGRHLYTSYTVAFIIFGLLVACPDPLGGILACTLPLVSIVLLNACRRESQRSDLVRPLPSGRVNIIKALLYLFILSAIFGLSQGLSSVFGAGDEFFTYKALLVAGVALFGITLSWVVNPQSQEALALYRPIFPTLICGLCALLFMNTFVRSIGSGLIIMAIYCLDMFIMLVSSDIAYRSKYSISKSFGVTIIVARIGTLCGSICALMLNATSPRYDQLHIHVILGCIMILAVLATVFADKGFIEALYTSQRERASLPSRDDACVVIAQEKNLTAREREVLGLLARGRTVKYIGEDLHIAPGTVKHHISNLYRKLGVLDRQELLDLIETQSPRSE